MLRVLKKDKKTQYHSIVDTRSDAYVGASLSQHDIDVLLYRY